MKLPFENKRYIVSIFLTIFITFFGQNFAYGNNAPVFTDGDSTTRTVAENTASGTNIGDPVAATDADNDVLTYGLSGTDAGSFSIVSTTGQLQTNAALDYETKTSYSVTVSVSDDNGGRNNTTVTITVTDVGEKPAFAPGGVILSVAENTASGTNIGDPFEATDPDSGDTLTYSLQRGDKDAFRIDPNTGQLRTHAALDYETKRFYTDLAVRATDSTGLVGSVRVTINVKDVDENTAPVFTDGSSTTRTIAENTVSGQNIGSAVAATDADNDTLIYTLGGDPDAAAFSIVSTTGQLQTRAALDYETKASYSVTVSVSDGNGGSGSITVSINVTDVNERPPRAPKTLNSAPIFTEGDSTTRTIAENTASGENIGAPVAATDVDANNDTLTYTLGGTDAAAFSIVRTTGQLQTRAALDYETKPSYAVSVSVSDGNGGSDSITVTIDVQDVPEITPPLSERTPQVRDAIIAKLRRVSNANDVTPAHLAAIRTLDVSNKKISALKTGDFNGLTALSTLDLGWNSIRDISALAGLTSVTELFLHANSISDISALEDLTSLTQLSLNSNSISDISALAGLTSLTRLDLPYNSISDISVLEGLTSLRELYLNNNSISDISALEDLTSLRYLYLKGNSISEYGPLRRLKAAIDAIEGHRGLTLDITIPEVRSPNNAPVFTDGATTTRSVAENTASGENIGAAIAATDADTDDTLTYTLDGTDAGAFRIVSTSGQLQTRAALDYETKSSYTVSVSVSDGNGGSDSITVTITVTDVAENNAPVFTDGVATTRSIAENTASGQNIGSAVAATDADNDTLTYSLGGTDAASFSIVRTSGQLQTNAALDYETKPSYAVSVSVSDGNGGSDSITVTINVTDVTENRAPVFSDGATTTRSIAENTAAGQHIGTPIVATDADNDTLTYSLGGNIEAAAFRIVRTSGQLLTSAALDYETKSSYAVTVYVSDGKGGSDSITVTIDVTDVNEPSVTPPLSERTPQVRNAIVAAVPGVSNANDVTVAHLAAITSLDVSNKSIRALKTGDFNGLTALTSLNLSGNSLSNIPALEHLTALTYLYLYGNSITDISALEGLTSLRHLYLNENSIRDISALEHLTSLTRLSLHKNLISDISALEDLTSLIGLNLSHNSISGISALEDLTSLTSLSLHNNSISDISALEGLTALKQLDLGKNAIRDISVLEGLTSPVSLNLWKNSISDVSALEHLTSLRELFLGGNSISDYGPLRRLKAAIAAIASHRGFFLDITIPEVTNNAPAFTDGSSATRSVAENTASGENIGAAIAAADADTGDTLTYTLGGTDAGSFGIVSTSGQLQTSAALDYETKTSYAVTVSVSDSNGGSDSIPVTINVSNVNEAPVFTEGSSATRIVAENTASGENIGDAVAATDVDAHTTLVCTLGGTDAASFSIVRTTGQLQTNAALDYETQTSYSVTLTVSDGSLTDRIDVTITVTDVNDSPMFTDGDSTTRTVAENTASGENIGAAVAATDADTEDVLTYSLDGTDASSFRIVRTTGQLQTNAALDYETESSYSVTVSVSDSNGGSDRITVRIDITDANEKPTFAPGGVTLTVAEDTASGTDIGEPITATDPDNGDTLTYSLQRGDAESFRIDANTGQLQTSVALDYETKNAYTDLAVRATDSTGLIASTRVTINVTDNSAPVFTDGSSATRSVAENTAAGTNIGTPVAATDADNDVLTYTLGGTDAGSFRIIRTTGQLRTGTALDYETKTSYSVTITVSDGSFTDTITVTIDVTNVNEAPNFTDGDSTTRSIAEHVILNIGTPIAATDPDNDPLTYSLDDEWLGPIAILLNRSDAHRVRIDPNTGQLYPRFANGFNYEERFNHEEGRPFGYSVKVDVSDGNGGSDSIIVTINVTDVNEKPVSRFTVNGVTRTIAENTAAGTNLGKPFQATDPDIGDTVTYSLQREDAESFRIDPNTGQIRTHAALDYETKNAYTDLAIRATDSEGLRISRRIEIHITNVVEGGVPVFTDGNITLVVAENTAPGTDIGDPITATDPDIGDTLTYSLQRGDAESFSIDPNTGQLRTRAVLNSETKNAYTDLAVRATDSEWHFGSTRVTIYVGDNSVPVFTDGSSTTRTIAENTVSWQNIGTPVAATDMDGDTLTYTLGGTDASSFSIVRTTGQLQTNAALDYETKTSYSVTIAVSDGKGKSDSIDVTIRVTNVNETPGNNSPIFTDGTSATRTVAENTAAGQNIGTPVAATDVDPNTTLTYSLGGTNASSFSIVRTSGQLQTNAALDYETKTSYSVTIAVSDGNGGSNRIPVTISVLNANDAPNFTAGSSTTRYVAENAAIGTYIGLPIAATDVDTEDILTYSLGGTDVAAFSIVATTGELKTNAALDYETKDTYSVTVTVSDGSFTDTITVTITVQNVNEAPIFTDGSSTTRSVAEDAAIGTFIDPPIVATDPDNDALNYGLNSSDFSVLSTFTIVSTTGALKTVAPLDFETKSSYSMRVVVNDSNGVSDSIALTINVTNVNETPGNNSPIFTDGTSATRTVAENTAAGQNIGSAVAATDANTGDVLTYTLGGTDAGSFSIVSTSGQLQTNAALDYETKTSYSVSVSVSDGNDGSDSIPVTIRVSNVNEAPVFIEGSSATRTVAESTASGENIGTAVAATDVDANTTLAYSLDGTDAASFSIVATTGQLQTSAALDYETKSSYSVTVTVSDGNGGSDSIAVTIDVTNNSVPVFTDGSSATRSIAENTASGQNIGTAVTATDANNDTLTYSLGGTDAASFSIVRTTGQLQTSAALDYETKSSYSVTVSVYDYRGGSDNIAVTINVRNVREAPTFTDGDGATRAVVENTASGENIGDPVAATDDDGDTVTYTLGGTDATSFSIVSTTGQLQTNAALDFESKASYSVTITASDGSLEDTIDVTIDVTDVDEPGNDPPTFTEGSSTTRIAVENAAIGTSIGLPIAATDSDTGDILTYSLGGIDVAAFSIVATTGELKTNAALDYETKDTYSVTVTVSDSSLTNTITVTITVQNVNEAPIFTDGSSTARSVAENAAIGTFIDPPIAATDPDNDALNYGLNSKDISVLFMFDIVTTTGVLKTMGPLDFETKSSYSMTVTVSDNNGSSDSIAVTINVTDIAGAAPSVETSPVIPENTELLTNYPNPFNPETWIPYQLAEPAEVTLTIYDVRGVVVRRLELGHQAADFYHSRSRAIHWDGRNGVGEKVASGLYFYTLKAGDFTATRKLLIRK